MAKRMTLTEFLSRYDAGDTFTEEELEDIFWGQLVHIDDCIKLIEEEYGENRRWSRMYYRYWMFGNRYFFVQMDEGLTEYQDSWYGYQPEEVKLEVVTRTITVTENKWTPVIDNKQ